MIGKQAGACRRQRWQVLSEREREVVLGPEVNAPVGICFMPSPDGKESWTVLADPEGNEFCVIRPKTTLVE
jgi:hypothetical protein